jgi:DNA-binding transcriptional LysR family regulator
MELRDLRCFVAVAEELHFGRAAARLHISPPPLTQRVKALEVQLGALLFKRNKRSVSITAAGAALLVDARRLLEQADALMATVHRAAQGETGHLRVGVMGSAIFSHGKGLQAKMSAQLPDVKLIWHELSSVEQVQSIRENRLDLGFINTPIDHEGLSVRRALREPLVAALPANHALAHRRSIPLRALRDETFIHSTRRTSTGFYDRFIAACNAAGFSPKIDHQAGHMLTYISLVAIGAGVTVVPASMARTRLDGVVFLAIAGKAPFTEISIAWNPQNGSPVLARALQLLDVPLRQRMPTGRTAKRLSARSTSKDRM